VNDDGQIVNKVEESISYDTHPSNKNQFNFTDRRLQHDEHK
jgi:hypothetical protein